MITGGWHIPYNQTLFFHNLPARFDAFYHFEQELFGRFLAVATHEQFTDISLTWISCDDIQK